LVENKKEYVLSKQLLRSGTSVGELLKDTDYLSKEQFESINKDAIEIIKLLTTILKSVKTNINN